MGIDEIRENIFKKGLMEGYTFNLDLEIKQKKYKNVNYLIINETFKKDTLLTVSNNKYTVANNITWSKNTGNWDQWWEYFDHNNQTYLRIRETYSSAYFYIMACRGYDGLFRITLQTDINFATPIKIMNSSLYDNNDKFITNVDVLKRELDNINYFIIQKIDSLESLTVSEKKIERGYYENNTVEWIKFYDSWIQWWEYDDLSNNTYLIKGKFKNNTNYFYLTYNNSGYSLCTDKNKALKIKFT
jgi:hypothetical protein